MFQPAIIAFFLMSVGAYPQSNEDKLCNAAMAGILEDVTTLLNTTYVDSICQRRTPLMLAAREGHRDVVELLLLNNANINHQSSLGWTALMYAARYGQKDVVSLLLAKNADVNLQNSYGTTALIWAAEKGHKDVVALLLLNNANVNQQNSKGWTALKLAAKHGRKDVVALLLDNNANINLQDSDGYTALMIAAYRGKKEVVELLLRRGADSTLKLKKLYHNGQVKHNETACFWNNNVDYIILNCPAAALFEASLRGNLDSVKELLCNGADVNATDDSNGKTPLLLAAQYGYKDIVALLLDNNANINHQDSDGRTALMLAAPDALMFIALNVHSSEKRECGHKEVVELLLTRGADTTLKDKWGKTAFW